MDNRLKEARTNVRMWLELTIRACTRELSYLEETGEIADGEIQSPWNLLQKAIEELRDVQEKARDEAEQALGAF